MADQGRGMSRFRLPWMSTQQIVPREPVPAPYEWRQTMNSRLLVCAGLLAVWTVAIESRLFYLQVIAHAEMTSQPTSSS